MEKERKRKQWSNTARGDNTKAWRRDFVDRPRDSSSPGFDEAKKEDGGEAARLPSSSSGLEVRKREGPMGQISHRGGEMSTSGE